jgi:hypothetical protein
MCEHAAIPEKLSHRQRLAIAESSYGRDCGWYVESPAGEFLAELVEWRGAEMFWDSYSVVPIAGHSETLTQQFWYPARHRFRNRQFRDFVVNSFGHFDPSSARVTLRALYLPVTLNLIDKFRAPLRYWRLSRRINRSENAV